MVFCRRTIQNALKIAFSSLHCLKVFDANIKYYKANLSQILQKVFIFICGILNYITSTELGEIPYIIGICREALDLVENSPN